MPSRFEPARRLVADAVRSRVVGPANDGRPYSANDPHLLKWVHIAEVDSFLAAHKKFGEVELSEEQRDGYVLDMSRIASYRSELRTSEAAHDAAKYLLITPPLPVLVHPAYELLVAAAGPSPPIFLPQPETDLFLQSLTHHSGQVAHLANNDLLKA